MHHGVKAGGASSKTTSDICRSDTYLVISDLCKLYSETSAILVITSSSLSETPGVCMLSCQINRLTFDNLAAKHTVSVLDGEVPDSYCGRSSLVPDLLVIAA